MGVLKQEEQKCQRIADGLPVAYGAWIDSGRNARLAVQESWVCGG